MNAPRRPPRRRVDGVLMLDKPLGMTSNAALQAARRLFNAQKAGHTGTLDPLATGLLPLCFGEATKFAGELLHADKSYRATLRLGVTTDTADAEGKILRTRPVAVDQSIWRTTAADFCGEIEQVPPMHSALKRDGKPLYEYARAGVDVPREPRRVRIYRLELISLAGDEAVIDVDCSKGTYVRTLAADIGEALGCGAHLAALRRTRIGGFDVTGAVTLAELDSLTVDARDERLHPTDALLSHLPVAKLAATDTERVLHGRAVPWQGETGRFRLYGANDQFLGLGDRSADGLLNPRRMIVSGEDR
ncbi:MAG TPA: tRNA pseudouridine(55) synthase TruB [Rhodocyclaceae bacterium]|nr:tRNA pseudouridine(55) synthase TruB [Rhodocyclaceae bacterium]